MMRQLPPKPDFDDALDIETAMRAIESYGEYADMDDQSGFESRLKLRFDATPLVTHIDQWVNYRACREWGITPLEVTTQHPDQKRIHDEHGAVAPVGVPLNAQQALTWRQIAERGEHLKEQARERLYQNVAETILNMLEEGHYDIPITQEAQEEVPPDDPLTWPVGEDELEVDMPERRRKTVTVGHKRLHIAGVQLGSDIYWQTERQAVEAYYDRCERIQDEEMVARDFRPYIKDPPTHVERYPEESRIPTYGEPVDWDRMADELFIATNRDLTDEEREELSTAIRETWPDEALV